ncbi:MAG: chemotaxis protein CheX [Candidatus Schekmanbacteria bacterium]|nr:chemotaxis protein CheX [Candidatus Schekmanbacteria bacterium]
MEKIENILLNAATNAFEQLCFMFSSPDDEDTEKNLRTWVASIVNFSGPFSGKLIVRAHKGLLNVIASNMLGEEASTAKQQIDALGEVSNVICGSVLPQIAGVAEVFNLEAPKILQNSEPVSPQNGEKMVFVSMTLDEGRVELQLFIKEGLELLKEV